MDIFRSVLWDIALIPVTPAVEPADFEKRVRRPGAAFLSKNTHPSSNDWRGHDYWRRAIPDLLGAYHSICSYSGSWTKANQSQNSTIQDSSVDHFIPKSSSPSQAYEWSNFRLSRKRLNNRKGNHVDVLDPFTLSERWFTLDFRSFLMFPNHHLTSGDRARVQRTIDRLELNTDNDYVQERVNVVREYCLGNSTMATIDCFWPFIASEMRAQDFDTLLLPSMRTFFRTSLGHP